MTLSVSHLCKTYSARGGAVSVLQDCSFELKGGESLSVTGPSGSGKSTLLSILGTLERADSGTVALDGMDVLTISGTDLPKFRREKIGFVFQEHHLLPQCSALENVLMPFLAIGRITPEQRERSIELLRQVGLADRLQHRPAELSGGERQRAAIARSLVFQPALLLADEPTGNLDRSTATRVGDLLLELTQNTMLIIVTHDPVLAGRTKKSSVLESGVLKLS
ncbi:lipoprotein-releasing system ATP-binding protein LolD 1 [Planctomycetales bacterium]|nr:lipoprotein-releasing system ATP-binding protein LolD 1 [Planctomycetales bacterium]